MSDVALRIENLPKLSHISSRERYKSDAIVAMDAIGATGAMDVIDAIDQTDQMIKESGAGSL